MTLARTLLIGLLIGFLASVNTLAMVDGPEASQANSTKRADKPLAKPHPALPVKAWGRTLVEIRMPYRSFSVADRVASNERRIKAIERHHDGYRVEVVHGTEENLKGAMIMVNDVDVIGLIQGDQPIKTDFESYAQEAANTLEKWLDTRQRQYSLKYLTQGTIYSLVATILALSASALLNKINRILVTFREKRSLKPNARLVIADINIRPYLLNIEKASIRLLSALFSVILVYAWLTFCLKQFPFTYFWGEQLKTFVFEILRDLGEGFLDSLPNIITIIAIFIIARMLAKLVNGFFSRVETGFMRSSLFEPETARATRRLAVAMIWVFSLVVAYPYFPGSGTEAFRGISVFLGLMVSLGSAGMVGQIIGGLVVVYTRAFQPGDFIKVNDHEGNVTSIGVLSTKIKTTKSEEINIPNAVLLAATTINYSRLNGEDPESNWAMISATVTIGYDTPWRKVHEMLLSAAANTAGVLKEPAPKVLQKALSDFYVEYELIVPIHKPSQRPAILSNLLSQIQDTFAQEQVQIMSPHFQKQPEEAILPSK